MTVTLLGADSDTVTAAAVGAGGAGDHRHWQFKFAQRPQSTLPMAWPSDSEARLPASDSEAAQPFSAPEHSGQNLTM
jgi:hypothetical protein